LSLDATTTRGNAKENIFTTIKVDSGVCLYMYISVVDENFAVWTFHLFEKISKKTSVQS
jgi:hypothetical protein